LDLGRRAGRGGLAVTAAKIYFILTGLVQQVALKAVLGLGDYGALSSALAAASIAYNPLVSASLQGVSHAVATSSEADREGALRRVLRVHLVLALLLGATFLVLAPSLGRWIGAPHIVLSLQLLSTVLVVYGLYAPLVGALNGRTRFGTQAALDALAATLRSVGLVGGAAWWAHAGSASLTGIEGATLGFAASSLVVATLALGRVGVGRSGSGGPNLGAYLRFIGPILLGQVLLNLLFQADQLLLRRFTAQAALAAGLGATDADRLVGAYRAMQLFCFLPYQLVLSISIVLFPVLARAHRAGDRATVARYVRQALRLALLLAGLVVSVTCGLSGPLLQLVFGSDTAALGARPMQLLALGLGTLALLGVLTAILNSIEQQRLALVVTGLAFGMVVTLCLLSVRGLAFGPELLWQTALATSLALLSATLVAAGVVRHQIGAVLSAKSLLRVLTGLAAALLVAWRLPTPSGLFTLGASLLVAGAYVAVLVALGELDTQDVRQLRRVMSRA
jgi:stage V sporulation protein B